MRGRQIQQPRGMTLSTCVESRGKSKTYHLLLGIVVRHLNHLSSILRPLPSRLQETGTREPFGELLQDREEVDGESAWNCCSIEVIVGVFDQVNKGVLSVLDFIAVSRTEDDTAS